MAYAMGYGLGVDKDLMYDLLLGVGDDINGVGLRIVGEPKIKSKIKRAFFKQHKKYLHLTIKVKFEDGSKIEKKIVTPFMQNFKLVQVNEKQQQEQAGTMEDLQKQLEALGLGGGEKQEEPKKKIGFMLG